MQASSAIVESPKVTSAEPVGARGESPPEWSTFEARRRRTLLFLIFAAVYVGYHLIVPSQIEGYNTGSRGWVAYPLFNPVWLYFGEEPPPWYSFETLYRWFLTLLPLAAWTGIVFFALTRVSFLTHRISAWAGYTPHHTFDALHRRFAFVVILLGLVFFEGDMRWFQMSQKHASWNDIFVVFDTDASSDLGLTSSLYEEIGWQFGYHILFLTLFAFLAGPEPRLIVQAIWSGPIGRALVGIVQAVWSGPLGSTYLALFCRWCYRVLARIPLEAIVFRVLGWLDSRAAFACIAVLVMIDPVVIWALDKVKQDNQADRTVVRQIADTNPLRWQCLDRAWNRVVFAYSAEAQELAAANKALRDLDSLAISTKGRTLAVPKRNVPAQPDNVLILQAETLSAEMFNETLADMPYLSKFSEKCLRLKRHFSAGNATHYGIMGLLHGNPVTFFTGPRPYYRHNPYLTHFNEKDYKTRLITRSVLSHHSLGHYVYPWTEPVSEPPGDFKCIPEIHEELAKPGPHLIYSFYHATHYPYDHDKEDRFMKFTPEVEYDFNYNRSGLFEWKEQIVNRYKNTLLNMDDWYRDILEKVDLSKTIVIITGDHGEEFFQQGRLGHCSSLNIHQTMTPCFVYIPGVEPADVTFVTSHADIMPTIADALGHAKKPDTLGQSLFEPVSFRYAILSHFEYTKCKLWAVATEDRMAVFERDYWDNVEITSLTDWNGQHKAYIGDAETWNDRFRIIRRVEEQLRASRD